MGRSRYRITDPRAPHFLTLTVLNWVALFTRPATAEILFDSLRYRQEHHDWRVYGFVVLENHAHLVIQTNDLEEQLMRFKSYTARCLIDYLEERNQQRILKQFVWFKKQHKGDREHQLWEEGSHPQLIENEAVLRQKLDYIHRNPVERGYVDLPEHWRWSSARAYAGQEGPVPVFTEWG